MSFWRNFNGFLESFCFQLSSFFSNGVIFILKKMMTKTVRGSSFWRDIIKKKNDPIGRNVFILYPAQRNWVWRCMGKMMPLSIFLEDIEMLDCWTMYESHPKIEYSFFVKIKKISFVIKLTQITKIARGPFLKPKYQTNAFKKVRKQFKLQNYC